MIAFHWRLVLAVIVGLAGFGLATAFGAPGPARALIGWNIGAAAYAAVMWRLFLTATEEKVRARAGRQDEGRGVLTLLVVVAILASLGAIIDSLILVKGHSAAARGLVTSLAALTLVSSWVVLQSVFVVHYAHRHFEDLAEHGPGGGFLFPGDPPRTYLDFAYLSICIGATAQISDPSVCTTRLRNLVTGHAVTSFFYNTAVLALGINILSGLIGH
ncbi:MAG TPA: DUF1345 domain-containing protein [Caulobacteraceae bacterium]